MNKYILIEVNNNINRFLKKCNDKKIELYDLNYIDNNKIIVKINKEDFKNIRRYNYYSDIFIYKKLGTDYIREKIFKLKYFILLFIMLLGSMYFISNIIFNVNVIHSNKKIRELVINELDEYGISRFTYKKNFEQLERVKNKILDNNKDKLEWISITNKGMKVIVRVEERITDNIKKEDNYCNIISSKDALVTNIYGTNGEIIVSVNDIVKKDDILISGDIILNEENKGYICASGKVMGRVWYNTNINLDRDYYKKEYTGNKRFNLMFNNKVLRNVKYNKYDKEYIIKNKFLSIYKEKEYNLKKYKYNETESIEKALLEVENKFKTKIGKEGDIVSKKILSKNITSNKIDLNLFVVVEEEISKQISLNIPEKKELE